MKKIANRRNRGVILTFKGWRKLQSAIKADSQDNPQNNLTLEELTEITCLSPRTVSRILRRCESVDKSSLQSVFTAFDLELCKCDYTRACRQVDDLEARRASPEYDWGEAPDTSVFYGRSMELSQLRHWVLEEGCRLVALLGIGGIGKSTLAVKLGLQVQAEFEVVVWRSLQNAPSVEENLTSILQFFLWALRKDIVIPENFDGKLSKLMECLRNHRCLLILDNVETILCSNGQTGQCRPGYEGYGKLLRCVGEVPHKSCLLLTSREKPREIIPLEGERTKVKCLQMGGLNLTEGRELIEYKGKFTGTKQEWQILIEHYGGNPLALKMLAAGASELFNGRIGDILDYLHRGAFIFEEMHDLLECQFQRLSVREKELMYWLAINREPISLTDLVKDVVTLSSKRHLPQTIYTLLQRSLIEKGGEYFFLQPVVMEYVTQALVEGICQKIIKQWETRNGTSSIELENQFLAPSIQTHALIKATSKDYIQETQKQLIVQPLLEQLLIELGSQQKLLLLLQDLLEQQRHQAPIISGYAADNILNLLAYLQVDLRGYDFSNLTIGPSFLPRYAKV
ncbi:MAG: NB-ARC domain-containing protein [Cyanobacteria bacterium J06635_10]